MMKARERLQPVHGLGFRDHDNMVFNGFAVGFGVWM